MGQRMILDPKLALLDISPLTPHLENKYTYLYQVKGIKNLVRLLIEKPVDLVILPAKIHSIKKLEKIFDAYQVPFLLVGEKEPSSSRFFNCEQLGDVEKKILNMDFHMETYRISRENNRVKFAMIHLKEFTDTVIHTTRDLFVAELKTFFSKKFKVESCHWVEVNTTSSKLPPILKLKQELEKQKVDQGALISDLDGYGMEMASEENFQIWKNSQGEYLCMIWLSLESQRDQYFILNKLQLRNRMEFQYFLEYFHSFLARRWALSQKVGDAQQQVYLDSLTSLYNQRFLGEVLAKKIEEHKRYNTPFSVLFIDVDHFKRVNDSLGHVIGSGVLGEMGDLLKGLIRNSDYAFRYGGDEFILLLSHTEGDDAVVVAERVRQAVEKNCFKINGIEVRITVSIGLAFFPMHARSAEEIIRIADEAMYYGKNKSRNIVYKAS